MCFLGCNLESKVYIVSLLTFDEVLRVVVVEDYYRVFAFAQPPLGTNSLWMIRDNAVAADLSSPKLSLDYSSIAQPNHTSILYRGIKFY